MSRKAEYGKMLGLGILVLIALAGIGLGTYVYQGGFSASTGEFERSVSSDDGLVGYWSFDEGSAVDYSGNGNDGTVIGAVATDGHRNGGMSFDGVSSYVTLPVSSIPVGNQITISLWAYGADSLPIATTAIEARDANDIRVFNIHLPHTGVIYFDCGNNGTNYDRISKTPIESDYKGKWNYWVFTKNANTGEMKIYLNGNLWHSGSEKTFSLPTSTLAALGSGISSGGTYNYYNGIIDEVRIYNRSLSADEVYSHYKDKVGIYLDKTAKTEPYSCDENTVALWHFDGSASDTCGTNDGILVGDASYGQGKFNSKGLELDGSGDYVDAGDSDTITGLNQFTIEGWFYAKDEEEMTMFAYSQGVGSLLNELRLEPDTRVNAQKVSWIVYKNGSKVINVGTPVGSVITNTWYHVVATCDGRDIKIYLDGIERASANYVSGSAPGDFIGLDENLIGILRRNSDVAIFNGTIDEVRISNVARTPEEIYEHYQQGLYKHQPIYNSEIQLWQNISWSQNLPASHYPMDDSMVGYWKFEGNAKDVSGNGNDGTVVGATLTEGEGL